MFDEYQLGLYEGKHEERERIIVLLDKYRESIVLQSAMSAGGRHALSDAIALIKGEKE